MEQQKDYISLFRDLEYFRLVREKYVEILQDNFKKDGEVLTPLYRMINLIDVDLNSIQKMSNALKQYMLEHETRILGGKKKPLSKLKKRRPLKSVESNQEPWQIPLQADLEPLSFENNTKDEMTHMEASPEDSKSVDEVFPDVSVGNDEILVDIESESKQDEQSQGEEEKDLRDGMV